MNYPTASYVEEVARYVWEIPSYVEYGLWGLLLIVAIARWKATPRESKLVLAAVCAFLLRPVLKLALGLAGILYVIATAEDMTVETDLPLWLASAVQVVPMVVGWGLLALALFGRKPTTPPPAQPPDGGE